VRTRGAPKTIAREEAVSTVTKEFQYGSHTVTLETGKIARQADGAVVVSMSETVVLVTVVGARRPIPAGISCL